MFCFEYNVLFILITKQSSVFFLVNQNGESAKSKWSLFGQNVATWKIMFRRYVVCLFVFVCFVLFFLFLLLLLIMF